MATFDIDETVICSCEIKDDSGAYKDPTTSMTIKIKQISPIYLEKVASVAMTKDAVGRYHYDCQTSGYAKGSYQVTYIATDGTRITIEQETFELV